MDYLKARIMSIQDMWAVDKRLLQTSDTEIKINWNSQLPTNEQLMEVLLEKQRRYDFPKESISPTLESVETLALDLERRIEDLWGAKFLEKPKIEVRDPQDYVPRINEISKPAIAQIGFGSLIKLPPGMFHSAFAGTIIVPSKFLAYTLPDSQGSMPIDSRALMGESEVKEYSWDRTYFESTLVEELTHALFRQLRGEWKDGYVQSTRTLGNRRERLSVWNEALAQYTKERLALTDFANWGLYVVADKIHLIWRDRFARGDYIAADALTQRTSLSNIALLDNVMPDEAGKKVRFSFFTDHPNNAQKEKKFRSSLNKN